jgi:hypothetical protein
MCGARLTDSEELRHHDEQMHPNMAGKKGGEAGTVDVRKPDRDRPVD